MPRVVEFLLRQEATTTVVTAGIDLQKSDDVDLIWSHIVGGHEVETTIEVKVDTQAHNTYNFAFETVSNEMRGTAGCFLRTKAELFYYLWTGSGDLWRMRTAPTRRWFTSEMSSRPKRFRTFETTTRISDGLFYSSYGRLVPLVDLKAGLGDGLRCVRL